MAWALKMYSRQTLLYSKAATQYMLTLGKLIHLPSNYLIYKMGIIIMLISLGIYEGYMRYYIKKAEHWRIDAFELLCWRRLLRVHWTARRSNQSILKEISPEYSLEGLILKLKLQYFGHLMRRADSLAKTLMLGKIEGRRRRGRQRMKWLDGSHRLDGHGFGWTPGADNGQGGLAWCGSWGCIESDMTERQLK